MIQIHLDKDGKGEGRMSTAAKVSMSKDGKDARARKLLDAAGDPREGRRAEVVSMTFRSAAPAIGPAPCGVVFRGIGGKMTKQAIVFSALVGLASLPLLAAPPAAPSFNTLASASGSFEKIADQVSPSVVQIFVSGYGFTRGPAGVLTKQAGTASGTVIDADGLIVTNAHVVTRATRVQVTRSLRGRGLAAGRARPAAGGEARRRGARHRHGDRSRVAQDSGPRAAPSSSSAIRASSSRGSWSSPWARRSGSAIR